ncbi:LamG domain-containing protein [Actinomadura sp. HBU206391]|uniref:LamG domain-containing protein n=1 Tax=Actinomadura sp. HBU206391 TaxID=2731692 RepID=UPI0016505CBA|nr:LamG domain-containing protein [Actinomadura sp. HBU206391]MBC6460896.1 LamG domain-containing protein [Actinomadura sp. HBU206391]
MLKGRWKFNTDGADDSGNGRTMTFAGAAHVDPNAGFYWGVSPGGLALNGPGEYAQTAGPVVAGDQSFTVSAWVLAASRPTATATVLSQAGVNTDRFALRYVPAADDPENQGSYEVVLADTDTAGSRRSTATHSGFTDGGWDHLALVYDASRDAMSLYVNGRLEENESNVSEESQVLGFNAANGGLQVGRSKLGGHSWPGLIDDVWAYQGALSEEQINILAAPRELETEDGP